MPGLAEWRGCPPGLVQGMTTAPEVLLFKLPFVPLSGVNQFCRDIVDMICRCPPWCSKLVLYFKACWVFITPCLLLVGTGPAREAPEPPARGSACITRARPTIVLKS